MLISRIENLLQKETLYYKFTNICEGLFGEIRDYLKNK